MKLTKTNQVDNSLHKLVLTAIIKPTMNPTTIQGFLKYIVSYYFLFFIYLYLKPSQVCHTIHTG